MTQGPLSGCDWGGIIRLVGAYAFPVVLTLLIFWYILVPSFGELIPAVTAMSQTLATVSQTLSDTTETLREIQAEQAEIMRAIDRMQYSRHLIP